MAELTSSICTGYGRVILPRDETLEQRDAREHTDMQTANWVRRHERPCDSCGAPIVFAISEKGKTMPVDINAVREGRRFVLRLIRGRLHASYIDEFDRQHHIQRSGQEPFGFQSHFATCPYADRHRYRGRSRQR